MNCAEIYIICLGFTVTYLRRLDRLIVHMLALVDLLPPLPAGTQYEDYYALLIDFRKIITRDIPFLTVSKVDLL